MGPHRFDSEDPRYPNLPDTDLILWSDYDDYLSNNSSDVSVDGDDLHKTPKNRKESTSSQKSMGLPLLHIFKSHTQTETDHKSTKSAKSVKSGKSTTVGGRRSDSVSSGNSSQTGSMFGRLHLPKLYRAGRSDPMQPTKSHVIAAGGREKSHSDREFSKFDEESAIGTAEKHYPVGGNVSEGESEQASGYSSNENDAHDYDKEFGNKVDIDDHAKRYVTDTEDDTDFLAHPKNGIVPPSILKPSPKENQPEFNSDLNENGYDSENENLPEAKEDIKRRKRKSRRRKKRARKYAGSQSKKERTAWEPGIDLRTTNVFLNTPGSIITVTDYSKTRYRVTHYDLYSEMNSKFDKFLKNDDTILSPHDFNEEEENDDPEFQAFMEYMNKVSDSKFQVENAIKTKPKWSQVRWINVNGLSWESIAIIGKKYNLHPLSVEDLVDIPQRTKMDIYQQHLFVVMPLLKLLKTKRELETQDEETYLQKLRYAVRNLSQDDNASVSNKSQATIDVTIPTKKTKTITTREQLNREFASTPTPYDTSGSILPRTTKTLSDEYNDEQDRKLAYEIEHSSTNRRLTDLTFISSTKSRKYRSRMSTINHMRPLMSKNLAVGVEQVSMYLTTDGTVITFFEHSASEIESAILSRLSAEYTILRESCNPSILFHSVLDANVDLLYPVITAYTRILNEKEMEVLTASLPDLQHTQELHLMLNELAILKNSILPISSLITQIKELSIDPTSPFIDESCKLYLADIDDHICAFIDEIDSMTMTISNLIDLIFNTLSVATNTSMQQLSLVTVLFLPLTFWAGYFGMNFKTFGNLDSSVTFFWKLAIPFTAVMMIMVMWSSVWRVISRVKRLLLLVWMFLKQRWRGEESSNSHTTKLDIHRWEKFRRAAQRSLSKKRKTKYL
ncbi:uncharacterized protein C5L36_0B06690 [Pichia kudriavzevii]|uniref:Magnesium transport protein CorA n=2 Tax=Pichia kudriavzevii TaxID=4909 RepID=A0A099P0T0_PICKU|nr:uncharacterized protein C5L36_0B06690 [Pichia kudriavzevii]AWU75424.1 hypothetical protein C5L36_0B06690 [Pichia kudriavzevii]KGK38470.1 hypothetical protein JL09_g2385 [Pichia kudriavzevii]ONH70527.1 Magnesium transport protein CorA [Pichia kudriavzevii]ONH74174.1 Magnesium transport protein CorA [Pichia kudriavzevii]